jgi:hypothetical protein
MRIREGTKLYQIVGGPAEIGRREYLEFLVETVTHRRDGLSMDMEKLAEIFEAVKVMPLRPQDFIVFRTRVRLNPEQAAMIHAYVEERPGTRASWWWMAAPTSRSCASRSRTSR